MRAKRSLSQNFLVDPNIQRKIVAALDISDGETVIEVGPGRGALTDHMAEQIAAAGGRLVAIELDDDLAAQLSARYRDRPDVAVEHSDVLEWDPAPHLESADLVKVVGNLPYNITSPLLFRLLEWRPAPERIVVMIQKEVADRILAEPGTKAYGALTVGLRAASAVERLFDVSRHAFRPVPRVDSAVIAIQPAEPLEEERAERLRSLTRAMFGMRRKQLQKALRTAPRYGLDRDAALEVLEEVGVEPESRPASMSPGTYIRLADALAERGYPVRGGAAA